MKKIHVVVQKKDIVPALESLRELGSVHVEHQEPLTGYQLEERREEVGILERAIGILKTAKTGKDAGRKEISDWTEAVNAVLESAAEVEHYKESVAKRQALISQWEPWGDFEPADIEALAAKGIYLRLYAVPKSKRKDVPQGAVLTTIYSSGGIDRCAAVSREEMDLPFEKIACPSMGLKRMRTLQNEEKERIERASRRIAEHVCYVQSLEKTLRQRREVLNFEEVGRGMMEDEALAVLKGFCPADACKGIEKKAREEHWGVLFEEPSAEDHVPTLLRNPRWVNAIKPLFSFINITPDYRELDISPVFLIFFSLFVGMLIGDAGYGMLIMSVFAAAHVILRKKITRPMFFYLVYLLCGCTIFWGVLTGTYFGQKWISHAVRPLAPWLTDIKNVQMLCFLIGAVHLSLAHAWRAVQKWPSLAFLADAGWFMIVWAMYFAANYFVLGAAFPAFASVFIVLGTLFLVLFPRPKFDPLLPLNIISCFTDIVSYIRLFAVGLATVAVADAANDMGIFWIVVLHALNIVLAALAILVHALRLNILEFSVHLNMTWAGVPYNPFRKINHR